MDKVSQESGMGRLRWRWVLTFLAVFLVGVAGGLGFREVARHPLHQAMDDISRAARHARPPDPGALSTVTAQRQQALPLIVEFALGHELSSDTQIFLNKILGRWRAFQLPPGFVERQNGVDYMLRHLAPTLAELKSVLARFDSSFPELGELHWNRLGLINYATDGPEEIVALADRALRDGDRRNDTVALHLLSRRPQFAVPSIPAILTRIEPSADRLLWIWAIDTLSRILQQGGALLATDDTLAVGHSPLGSSVGPGVQNRRVIKRIHDPMFPPSRPTSGSFYYFDILPAVSDRRFTSVVFDGLCDDSSLSDDLSGGISKLAGDDAASELDRILAIELWSRLEADPVRFIDRAVELIRACPQASVKTLLVNRIVPRLHTLNDSDARRLRATLTTVDPTQVTNLDALAFQRIVKYLRQHSAFRLTPISWMDIPDPKPDFHGPGSAKATPRN